MTAQQVAKLVGAEEPQVGDRELLRVAAPADATGDAIVFALDEQSLALAVASGAGLILLPASLPSTDERILRARDAKYAFALCGQTFAAESRKAEIHSSAVIHATAQLGSGTSVGAGAVIEADVVVGAGCSIGSRVTVCRGAKLGERVVVQSGAVLGSAGFGYVRNAETGKYLLFPQQGTLVIEDDVEIGANTTIDRGALGETRIGRGTKIDNLVHIGHNCSIGEDVVIAAQVGISGSCVIGNGALLAGQVGLGDHVTLGEGVILGGQGGVFPGKTVEGPGQMFGGTPAEPVRDYLKSLARLRRLK